MNNFKFELNSAGVKELLKSEEMKSILNQEAESVLNKCGPGYVKSVYSGRNRANASVRAESPKAKIDNNKNNSLLKAIK